MIVSEKRLKKLSKLAYRQEYRRATTTAWLVHQLRALRYQRGWTQADLGAESGKAQSAIGRFESESYGNWNANTLQELADAFDVGLIIKFVSWPDFVAETENTSPEKMFVSSFSAAEFTVSKIHYQRFAKPFDENQPRGSQQSAINPMPYRQMSGLPQELAQ